MTDTDPNQAFAHKLLTSECEFVAGVATLDRLPDLPLPEIAFAGRSNVGKSSLINALTRRKALARTSHTPGRTQQLNFFNIGKQFHLVDMPGYGYAKVSKTIRDDWQHLILTYLQGRPNLRAVFVLVDSRHGLKETDTDLLKMMDKAAVSARIILTKCDKTPAKVIEQRIAEIQTVLKKHPSAFPDITTTSAHDKIGIEALQLECYNLVQ